MFSVSKPIHRSALRQFIGKEYFCFKQKLKWHLTSINFASDRQSDRLAFECIRHQSALLRKLKEVDMQLQYNKITNLDLACKQINGIVIRPGETFSFWKLVGKPTKKKGYLTGMTLHNGKVEEGIGGGLCQLGNLIYWMLLHTPLTVTKRWRHSYDVFPDSNRTLPFGSGATLAYNYIDLQFRNNTSQAFQINLWFEKMNLCGSIHSDFELKHDFEVYEKNHRFELQWWGGYTRHNEIWRTIIAKNDQRAEEELITENHAVMMYNPLLPSGEIS